MGGIIPGWFARAPEPPPRTARSTTMSQRDSYPTKNGSDGYSKEDIKHIEEVPQVDKEAAMLETAYIYPTRDNDVGRWGKMK